MDLGISENQGDLAAIVQSSTQTQPQQQQKII